MARSTPFERVPGEPVLGVLMVERDRPASGPSRPAAHSRRSGPIRSTCSESRGAAMAFFDFRQRQVVDQAEAISLPERADLVLAIGVEGGEVDVERAARRPPEIDRPLLPLVPDHELAPLVGRREHDDQRRDHPVELLAVAMGQEEAPRLVEQQVVEVALQLLLLQPQLVLDLGDRLAR